jgi:hypothetical protein
VYGNLIGGERGYVAALDVWCSNTGDMAAGQLRDSWVIYTGTASGVRVIGVLAPQQPADPRAHVPIFAVGRRAIDIRPGQVIVHESWYSRKDSDCCPSTQATTVWTYAGGKFSPKTTVSP